MLAAYSSRPAKALLKCACPRSLRLHCCQAIVRNKVTMLQLERAPLCCHQNNGLPTRLVHSTEFTCSNKDADNTVNQVNPLKPTSSDDTEISLEPQVNIPESFTDVPGTTNTKSKTLAIIYTCKVCDTRSAKQVNIGSHGMISFTDHIISHFFYFTSI